MTIKSEASKVSDAFFRAGISWGGDFQSLQQLIRAAWRHARIQERWASVELSESQTAALEKTEATLEARITKLAESMGLRASFEGDPRGFTVRLHTPSGDFFNTMGGPEAGYGIGSLE